MSKATLLKEVDDQLTIKNKKKKKRKRKKKKKKKKKKKEKPKKKTDRDRVLACSMGGENPPKPILRGRETIRNPFMTTFGEKGRRERCNRRIVGLAVRRLYRVKNRQKKRTHRSPANYKTRGGGRKGNGTEQEQSERNQSHERRMGNSTRPTLLRLEGGAGTDRKKLPRDPERTLCK